MSKKKVAKPKQGATKKPAVKPTRSPAQRSRDIGKALAILAEQRGVEAARRKLSQEIDAERKPSSSKERPPSSRSLRLQAEIEANKKLLEEAKVRSERRLAEIAAQELEIERLKTENLLIARINDYVNEENLTPLQRRRMIEAVRDKDVLRMKILTLVIDKSKKRLVKIAEKDFGGNIRAVYGYLFGSPEVA